MPGKIVKHFKFDLVIYWTLISMQQILVSFVLQSENTINPAMYGYAIVCLIGVIICLVALVIRPNSVQAYRKYHFHRTYGNKTFLFVILEVLLIDCFLLLSLLINTNIFYVTLAPVVIMIAYLAIQRPFKRKGNNVRLILL